MSMTTALIEKEKAKLIEVAEKHGQDLQHPEVLSKSEELDRLIVAQMRLQKADKVS